MPPETAEQGDALLLEKMGLFLLEIAAGGSRARRCPTFRGKFYIRYIIYWDQYIDYWRPIHRLLVTNTSIIGDQYINYW